MLYRKVHKSFCLNGNSFDNIEGLLNYVAQLSEESLLFLNDWFDENSFVVVRTSGSTGEPKPIRIDKQHMLNSAQTTGDYFNLFENTTALLCMSSGFIAGKMMWVRALTLGWKLDVVAVSSNPLENSSSHYDFVAMVPLQVSNSLDKLGSIDILIVGGGVVSSELENSLQDISTQIYATYGMTETVTHVAVKKINHRATNSSEIYQLLPSIEIETDNRGCLVIDAPFLSDEKVVTNDLVQIISPTKFIWLGRYDSIINSGGIKLIPEQIEIKISKVLSKRFFVAGVKDSLLVEKIVLIVEGTESKITDKSKINEFLNGSLLDRYEVPKIIYFMSSFILTETGKIQRSKVLKSLNLSC